MCLNKLKKSLRAEAKKQRDEVHGKKEKSDKIVSNLISLPQFERSSVVMAYLSFSSEVQTLNFIKSQFTQQKKTLIPYCVEARLEVFWLKDFSELTKGAYGILEPNSQLRKLQERKCSHSSIDFVIVPGLGFDSNCRRIGYGKGYYDRFLSKLDKESLAVGLAFDEQIFPEIPCDEHDRIMDMVITPTRVIAR